MRFLFDQNLSPKLVGALADVYPDALHVRDEGLKSATDEVVWKFASERGLTIVSKDEDFHQRSLLLGPLPKVVWIRRGNCSTREIEDLLRHHVSDLEAFERDPEAAFLALS